MLNLGQRVGAPAGADASFLMRPENLLRHAVLLGGSGSGKTVASKVLVEEMLREGVPAILVDPQGDLASLALPGDPAELAKHGVPDATAREVLARAEVVVWTPGSDAGIPLGLSPLSLADMPTDPDERAETLSVAARAVVSLLGLNLEKDEGKSAEAASVLCLEDALVRGAALTGFEGLAEALTKPSAALAARLDGVSTGAERDSLAKKLRRALVGSTGRLFDRGVPLDIDVLLGRDPRLVGPAGSKEAYARTRCSVIYLNSLSSAEEKEFFVAELARALARWMLQHPSEKPQCLFFIDEVAPFLPPVRKPACRDALRLLVKQARKYGVACAFATQNPGDIDYKSLAQCSTWALGRITQKQDLKKLTAFLKGVAPDHVSAVEAQLPARPAGELLWLAPDVAAGVIPVRTRWLVTAHKTLDLDDVKALTTPEMRQRFARLAASRTPAPKTAAPAPASPASKGAIPQGALAASSAPASPVPEAEPARGAKAKSGRSSGAKARPAAAATPADADVAEDEDDDADESAPSELEALKPRLVALLERDMAAYTADEVVALVPAEPPGRVRRALRELSEANALKREKCGRAFVHWLPRYAFDLAGKRLRPVLAAEPRILEGDAAARAQRHARSKFVFLDAEKVSALELRYLPLHRVKVRATRQKGFFVKESVTVDSTVYLHPRDARVLELAGDTFRFVPAPRANAEDVRDLDQVVQELPWTTPGAVPVDPDLAPTLGAAEVEAALRRKFAVDEVLGIDLVHLPYWQFRLVDDSKKTERVGRLDALLGGWLVLEEEAPPAS